MADRKIIELEDGWQLISSGIKKIENILEGKFEDPLDAVQWAVLYTTIYNMSTQKYPHNYSQQLYDRYRESLEEYINSIALSSLREKHDYFMLRELVRRWDNHKIMVRWLSRFFGYLHRFFIPQSSLSGLNTVGLKCFRDLVYQEVKANVRDVVIALIHREREGEQVDRYLLKNVLGIFVEIGMGSMDWYESDFEKALLEDTAAYYSRKASSWILEDSCPDYMLKAEECLKKEKERVDHYLHAASEQKLLEGVQHVLLSQYEIQLLEKEDSGVHSLLRDNKEEDLRRMYRLFHKIPEGLEPVAQIFKQHVTDEGTRIVIKAENDASNRKAEKKVTDGALEQEFMSEIIELYKKFMHYVSMCFGDHTIFHKAQKEAFEVFCNKGVAGSTNAELLATFCDYILRKGGSEKLSDEAIEDILEKAVKILACISEKDLFGEFYRKKLAQRLLFDKGVNLDLERSIITKLKEQCGGQFTSKIEGMVRDLTLAKENQTNFGNYIDSHDNEHISVGIDLSVTVLTTGLWPSYKSLHLNLPTEMVKCIEVYREFYQTKNNHKKLTWIYSLGQCNLTGKFSKKTIDITVTTYQAAALLLFNSSETLSYAEIKSQLNLADEDTVRMLHSLSCAKYKILEKQPATKKVTESDCFKFNANFTDIKRRIKISLPPVDEKNKVIEGVESNRRYAIEAAIVRIMKSRKVVYHSQLITECVEKLAQLFKPSIKDIKKGIQDLITRAYMERDEANPAMYRYLA